MNERGSVVVEALVALLIVGFAVGMLFQSIGGGARQTAALANRERAMLVAQSRLAQATTAPVAGLTTGVEGDLRWSVAVTNVDGYAPDPLAQLTVRVSPVAGGAPLATLSTLRLRG